jgi:hypothetical protein
MSMTSPPERALNGRRPPIDASRAQLWHDAPREVDRAAVERAAHDLLVALGAASRPKACVILHGGWRPFTPSCSRRSRSA